MLLKGAMDIDEPSYQKIYKKMSRRFIRAFLLMITIFLVKQFLIYYQIVQTENISNIINVAGRQRMLSQKIAKNILHITQDTNSMYINYYVEDLEESLELWESSHYNLVNINNSELFLLKNNSTVSQMFQDLELTFLNLMGDAQTLLSEFKEFGTDINQMDTKIKEIDKLEGIYLDKMDAIVYQYEYEARQAIQNIKTTHMVLFTVIVGMLIFITIMIFIPVLKYLKNAFWSLSESNNNLIKMFHTMKGALFVVKKDGKILFMNGDAEKIIIRDKLKPNILYLSEHIHWLDFNILQVIEESQNNDSRVEDIDTQLKDKEGNIISVLVSAISGTYGGYEAVMVSLFDITAQKKAEATLINMATKDELTGLYNRHFLDSIIGEEIDKAERYKLPLSAILLDLDYFKQTNDDWGHPVGDSVLQLNAEIIKDHIRISDYAVRIGGEEFLILMPNTSATGAVIAAENLRKIIEKATHPLAGKFTASFGVAERNAGESYQSLYKRIDSALYEAKESGRNCVIKAQSLEEEYTSVSLRWNKNWNCGEKLIDEQHKELFRKVSQFANSPYLSEDKENILKHLNDIIDHVTEHFNYEEKVLYDVGYKDYIDHKKIHKYLLNRAQEIKDAVITGTIDSMKAFALIFDEIIVDHLLCEDIRFYSCFNQKVN